MTESTDTAVPKGFWQRDVLHCPQPLSTLMATAVLPFVGDASRHWFAGVGAIPERLEWREIGGWTYLRRVDAVDARAARAGAITRGNEVVAEDMAGAGVHSWRRTWRPEIEARTRALRAVDRSRLTDDALAEHLAATLDHQADALEVHFRVHAVITAALADLQRTSLAVLGSDANALRLLEGRAPAALEVPASLDRLARIAAEQRERPRVPPCGAQLSRPGRPRREPKR